MITSHDFHNSASLRHSWVMRSSVTPGNKWSFPSAYCISPFITFLLPTFKVLSPSILFYSGITFRCRDVYESGQNGSVQLGFTRGRAMLTHRYKCHFFPSHQTTSEPLQPNYASAQDLVFVLNKVQCFLLIHAKIICGASFDTEMTRHIIQITVQRFRGDVWGPAARGCDLCTSLHTTGQITTL